MLAGYPRADGRKGIRNVAVVVYLVECAHHVARGIAAGFDDDAVHLIGFPGCYPNAYALDMLEKLCTHPNVGAALLVSLGCEGFDRRRLARAIEASGRPVRTIAIQETGGTTKTITAGREWIAQALPLLAAQAPVPMRIDELTVGTICGGSDATSGLTANPAMGIAFDLLVGEGAKTIFEETGELIGMEHLMAARAANAALGQELKRTVAKAAEYYATLGYASFAPGNADGGLTTIEEKSLGAYAKSGQSTIDGIVKPGIAPPKRGLYLLDVVPDGEVRFGFPEHQRQRGDRGVDRVRLAGDPVFDGPRLGRRLRHRARHQGLRKSGDVQADGGGHGCRRGPHPRGSRDAAGGRARDLRPGAAGRQRRADEIGGAGPSRVHPDLQELRPPRSGVPADVGSSMHDMLVRLYSLPSLDNAVVGVRRAGDHDSPRSRAGTRGRRRLDARAFRELGR